MNVIVKLPDRVDSSVKLGGNYYKAICKCALELDLDNDYYFQTVLNLFNRLVLLRKTESIVLALRTQEKNITKLVSEIQPQSVFFYCLFRIFSEQEIFKIFPSLPGPIEEFLTCQIAFKCKTRAELQKLEKLLKKYDKSDKCLYNIVKI